jgi:quercetin dioxygenase-like cupin family protein
MTIFKPLAEIPPQQIWNGVLARAVEGERMSFAVVELEPHSVVAEHRHPNEQIGIVLKGSMTFTIGGEARVVGAGDTYNIPGGVPHDAVTGPEGAVVIDVFSPVRADWSRFEQRARQTPVWP